MTEAPPGDSQTGAPDAPAAGLARAELQDIDLLDPSLSPCIPFADAFDLEIARAGPVALFTLDPRGQLRLALNRSREQRRHAPGDHPRAVCHCMFLDRATRHRQYVLTTSPALCMDHPRADIETFESQQEALAAVNFSGQPASR